MYLEIGDTIECDVQNPEPKTLFCRLVTPESLQAGRELVAEGRWRKSSTETVEKIQWDADEKGKPT